MMDYIREKREDEKGFTLAELLIVVAIIAVLVAIAIPVFSAQLEKSREATDLANLRSAYGEVVTNYLGDGSAYSCLVSAKQTNKGWQTTGTSIFGLGLAADETTTETAIGGKVGPGAGWNVSITTSGSVTVDGKAVSGQKVTKDGGE